MAQKQSIALVALLVLGLAAVVMSAPSGLDHELAKMEQAFGSFVCDTCKSLVAQTKDQIPMLKPQLEQLCQYCGSDESNAKCKKAIDDVIDELDKKSPESICQDLSLCKKGELKSILGL